MNKVLTENLRGVEVKFKTRPGIFSKSGLDSGSKLLIENIDIEDKTVVADLGCGSGVMGFFAAKLNPAGHVHLLDDHLRAVELAKENVSLNNLKNVEVYLSDLFSAVENRSYHLILSNPAQHLGNEFLNELVRQSLNHLKPEGQLWLVVQKHVKNFMERVLKEVFDGYEVVAYGRDHVVIRAKK